MERSPLAAPKGTTPQVAPHTARTDLVDGTPLVLLAVLRAMAAAADAAVTMAGPWGVLCPEGALALQVRTARANARKALN